MAKKHLKEVIAKTTDRFNIPRTIDYQKLKPIFSFIYMKYQGPACLSRCDQEGKASIIEKLLELSQITWEQIHNTRRQGLGYELIPINRFSVSMPPFVTPDVDKLQVFRYSSSGRIAGIRERDIYHILLVGTSLYPH